MEPLPGTPKEPAEALARFGARDGLPIRNIETVLGDLWVSLGRKPKIIYGLCERGSPYGHSFTAVERFNPQSTKTEFMVDNIVGVRGSALVQPISLGQYLFGVNDFKGANRQRSAYNRPYELYCLHGDHLTPDQTTAYYQDLAERYERGEAKFSLLFSRVLNVATGTPPLAQLTPDIERGNCARFSHEGLNAGDVFDHRPGFQGLFANNTIWPKRVAIRLLDGRSKVPRDQIDVVAIPRIDQAVRSSRASGEGVTYANPLTMLGSSLGLRTARGARLRQLSSFAIRTLEVPPGTMTAEIRHGPPTPRRPMRRGGGATQRARSSS